MRVPRPLEESPGAVGAATSPGAGARCRARRTRSYYHFILHNHPVRSIHTYFNTPHSQPRWDPKLTARRTSKGRGRGRPGRFEIYDLRGVPHPRLQFNRSTGNPSQTFLFEINSRAFSTFNRAVLSCGARLSTRRCWLPPFATHRGPTREDSSTEQHRQTDRETACEGRGEDQ